MSESEKLLFETMLLIHKEYMTMFQMMAPLISQETNAQIQNGYGAMAQGLVDRYNKMVNPEEKKEDK